MGKHNTSIAGDLTTLPAPNPSTPEATRTVPFDLPLQRGGYGDDIIDAAGNLTIQLYGDERVPETLEQRDYLIRAVNSYDDMLAVLKAIAIAQKEPAGGEYWTARELANKWGIFTDDLAGERVLLKLAEYAISKAERGQ